MLKILNECSNLDKICPEVGINIAQITNFSNEISDFDRNEEKDKREGNTMEFGIKNALIKNPKAEIIYDKGGFGKKQ